VVGTTGKPRIRTLFCYNLRDDDEAYPNPETPRAAEAPNRGTLWQLDFTSELGLRFPKTKTSNAIGLPQLATARPRRTVLQLWQENTADARGKFLCVPQGNQLKSFLCKGLTFL